MFYWKFEALFEFLFFPQEIEPVAFCLGYLSVKGEQVPRRLCCSRRGLPAVEGLSSHSASGLYFQLIVVVGPETG